MDEDLTKYKATNYDHCIIKEEFIISDDEKDDSVHVKIEPIDEFIMDTNEEKNKSDGQFKWESGLDGNKNIDPRNDKRSIVDLFLKSENVDSNEQSKISKNVTINKKPKATGRAACTYDSIDKLYNKYAQSYCHKCNVKRAVIRRKARCPKCKTKLTYSCEDCGKTYGDFTELGRHLKIKHTSQIHSCPVCQKTFAYRSGLVAHQRIQHGYVNEAGVVLQKCAKCGKIFESKLSRQHEKVCGKETPWKCDKCPYATTHQSNLKRHVHSKHTDFEKECENCKKFFTNRKTMLRHLRVYCNKVKQIECHHCGHKTYRKDQMVKHLDQSHFEGLLSGNLVNDSQMSRNCKYCDTTLDRYEGMKDHLRQCESAPLKFRRIYRCDRCNLSYCYLKHLNRHEKIHHPSEPTTKVYEKSGDSSEVQNIVRRGAKNFVAISARTRRTSSRIFSTISER